MYPQWSSLKFKRRISKHLRPLQPPHIESSLALTLACFSWLFTICGSVFRMKLFLQFLCNRVPLYIYGVKAPSGISSGQIPDLITYQLSKESSLKLTSTQLLRLTSLIKFPSQAKSKSPCLVTPSRHYHLLTQSPWLKSCCSDFEIKQMVLGFGLVLLVLPPQSLLFWWAIGYNPLNKSWY